MEIKNTIVYEEKPFKDIAIGDCFLLHGGLYMRTKDQKQCCTVVLIGSGTVKTMLPETMVRPVHVVATISSKE